MRLFSVRSHSSQLDQASAAQNQPPKDPGAVVESRKGKNKPIGILKSPGKNREHRATSHQGLYHGASATSTLATSPTLGSQTLEAEPDTSAAPAAADAPRITFSERKKGMGLKRLAKAAWERFKNGHASLSAELASERASTRMQERAGGRFVWVDDVARRDTASTTR